MRLFLAIELEESVNEAIDDAIAPLRDNAPELAWAARDKRHLTLKFLGDVDASRADRLTEMMGQVAQRHKRFDMQVSGVGAFPNFRRARVVWIGVGHEPRLEMLQHDLEIACAAEGFDVEARVFRPHLTLARVGVALGEERVRRFARAARTIDFAVTSLVTGITMFESKLAQDGARYRRVHSATLGEATGGF